MISATIIVTYEIVSSVKGSLDTPNWLRNAKNKVCKFWESL